MPKQREINKKFFLYFLEFQSNVVNYLYALDGCLKAYDKIYGVLNFYST